MGFSDNFAERLLKGRLGEAVFELMFREDEQFDILPLGYERITPEHAQYQHHAHVKAVIDNIRNLPDFILVSKDKQSIYLVEVKYRAEFHPAKIKAIAREIDGRWSPVWLFLATPQGFYFSPCSYIAEHDGQMERLNWISQDLQPKYLGLLKRFMPAHSS